MSLTNPQAAKQYRLGIVAAKNFDDPSFLADLIDEKIKFISHVSTNGANDLVTNFCQENGISYTVFPLTGGRSLPWSSSMILDNSDFVFIIASPDSKSAEWTIAKCVEKNIKHRLVAYDPFSNWQEKVGQIAEILVSIPKEEIVASAYLKAIQERILDD